MRTHLIAALAAIALLQACQSGSYGAWPRPPVPGTVREYPCRYTTRKPDLNGGLEDGAWAHVPWSEPFMDKIGRAHV